MEKILKLKEKHVTTPLSEIKTLIQLQAELSDKIQRIQKERFHEDEKEVKQLMIRCLLKKEELEKDTKALQIKTEEFLKKKQYYDMKLDIQTSAVHEKKKMEEQLDKLKTHKPNTQDQKLLELGQSKFNYYKMLTGIRWNYESANHSIEGYITNKDYIKYFSFKNQKINADIVNSLWQEIYLSVKKDESNEDVNDENREPNIAKVA